MKYLIHPLFIILVIGVAQVAQAQKANQQISFASPSSKTYGDAPFDLVATTTSGLPVTFTSSNSLIASISGTTVTIKNAGTIEITASQAGNDAYNAAPDVRQVLVISKADQVITFQTLPSLTYGDPQILITATSTSGLPVTFTSSNTSIAAVSGNYLFNMGAGECLIIATQPGNNNFNAASVSQVLLISKASQIITFNVLSNKTYGDPTFGLGAHASSGLQIVYESSDPSIASILGNQVTIEGAGTVNIIASQAGDNNFLAASNVLQTLTVLKAVQIIDFPSIGTKTYGDIPFNLIASANTGLPLLFISQYDSVATVEGSLLTIVGAGKVIVTALQEGNKNYLSQSTTQTLTISKAAQSITFGPLAPKKFGDPPFQINATTTSGLAVIFNSGRKPIARVSGTVVSIAGAGTALIIASQPGNSNYLPAPDIIQTFPITALGNSYPLVGTTRSGGNGRGTIYNVNSSGSDHIIQTNFKSNANNSPQAGLKKMSDAKLVGTIMSGGTPANGVVFAMNADGTDFSIVHNFQFTDGQRPFGNVLEAANGVLYGMTFDGGAFNTGVIFKVNKDGSDFSTLHSFPGTENGFHPLGGLIQAADGDLYGMTKEGGSVGYGNLFKIKSDGAGYTKLLEFDGTTKGSYPRGDLIQGADHYLYGLTSNGGSSNKGILFKVKTDGTNFIKLVDFDGLNKGSNPGANLIIGTNGKLFGLTQSGGTNDKGTIFSVNNDGTGFVKLFDFDGTNTGSNSVGSLVQSISDNYLYGMTNQGGASDLGTVFKIKTDGTGFTKLLDFNGVNGANPVFGPLLETQPGVFLGMTSLGGASNTGVVFSITSNGAYSLIKDFPQLEGTPEVIATESTIGENYFGVASSGGIFGNGAIFKTAIDGSGYMKLADIGGNFVFVNKLITVSDGHIWGIGREGVFTFNYFLFRYKEDGTGFQRLLEFDNGAMKGSAPMALLEAPGGMIYGTTHTGGSFNSGIIFKIKMNGTDFSKVADVPGGLGGSRPIGNLILTSEEEIIGMTQEDGSNNNGAIFKLNTGNQYVKLFDLSTITGASPQKIIELNDGSLCVITAVGGTNNMGASFTISKDGSDFNLVRDFNLDSGIIPLDLIQTVDGYLIGTTREGGQNNQGLIYQMLADGSDFKKIFEFNGPDGSAPNNLFFKKTEQIITFDALEKKQFNDPPFLLSASCSSGLPIQYSSSDETIASISGNEVTIKSVGQVTITARVLGNKNFYATSFERSLVIDKADQLILFDPIPSKFVTSSSFNLSASSSSDLSVTFSAISDHISISGNHVSILSEGSVTIDASQSGNFYYRSAPTVSNTFCINPVKPTIGVTGTTTEHPVLASSGSTGNQWYKNGVALSGQTAGTITITESGVYTVIITVEGCSSEPSEQKAIIITGVSEIVPENISIFPNPTSAIINLDLRTFSNRHDVHVEIQNSIGLIVYSHQNVANIVELNVQSLAKGIYIIKASQNNKVKVLRFVKND